MQKLHTPKLDEGPKLASFCIFDKRLARPPFFFVAAAPSLLAAPAIKDFFRTCNVLPFSCTYLPTKAR